MEPGSRKWALDVLGVPEGASEDQIERAYLELQAVWEPHKLAGDEWAKTRASQELDKIEKARRLLAPDAGNGSEDVATRPINPALLVALIVFAFGAAFFATRAYRLAHQPTPEIVIGNRTKSPPKIELLPPTVDISSKKIGEPFLTPSEQGKIQKAIAGLTSGLDALQERDALTSMGEKAIPSVTAALSSQDPNVRMNAALILNTIAAGPDTAPNSDSDKARLKPFFDRAKTVDSLSKLATDPNTTTRQNVAYGLGNIGDPGGFDTLTHMVQDTDSDVRAGVAYSLGKLKNVEAVPTLITLLNDPELSVRETAVEALRPFDTPDAKSALTQRLPQETDPQIIDQIKAVLEGRPSPNSDEGQP